MLKHASRACFGGVLPNLCLLRPVSCVRRFALPHKLQLLGLPAGMCVKLKVSLNGKKDIEQAFNPISTDDTPGEMTVLVKVRAAACIPVLLSHHPLKDEEYCLPEQLLHADVQAFSGR